MFPGNTSLHAVLPLAPVVQFNWSTLLYSEDEVEEEIQEMFNELETITLTTKTKEDV